MVVLILLLLFSNLGFGESFLEKIRNDEHPWVEIRHDRSLRAYNKDLSESELFAFKAKGILEGPIEIYLEIIRQISEHKRWSPSLIDKFVLKDISDIEVVTRDLHFLPWPLQNRDLIVHNKLYIDHKRGFLVIGSRSLVSKDYPVDEEYVRAHLSAGAFYLRPYGEAQTEVELIIHIDPKGMIPHWLVNELQKNWPIKYLRGLEKVAKEYKAKGLSQHVLGMLSEIKKDGYGRRRE